LGINYEFPGFVRFVLSHSHNSACLENILTQTQSLTQHSALPKQRNHVIFDDSKKKKKKKKKKQSKTGEDNTEINQQTETQTSNKEKLEE
jgi:hypothetical protein